MWNRAHRAAVVSLQLAGLLLFSASAPLAHLHPQSHVPSGGNEGGTEHGSHHHGITFHAHFHGHPRDGSRDDSDHPEHQGEKGDDSLDIANGPVDAPRSERLSKPVSGIAAVVELGVSSAPDRVLGSARSEVLPLPPLLFQGPVRAPPSSC